MVAASSAGLGAGRAAASGFASARFGGEHATAADAQPTALYYNPGAIGLLDGQQLMVEAAFALRTASYTRDPSSIDDATLTAVEAAGFDREQGVDALAGKATLDNVLVLPFVGAVSDLGSPRGPVRVGAAFFVPFGGQSSWDTRPGDPAFPGSQDGPTRWYNIEGSIRSLALSLGAAYRIEAARLSVGASGSFYMSEVSTVRARNADAGDDLITADGGLIEGRSLLDVSGNNLGFGVGVAWEAMPQRLWLGASYQSQPGLGRMQLDGTLRDTFGSAPPAAASDVVLTEELPDIVRLGARMRPVPDLELRIGASWTRWSKLDQMCLADADTQDLDRACRTGADGALDHPEEAASVVQIFQRDWRDAPSVGVGGSYFLGRDTELYAGVAFDGNAIPDATLDPALVDMSKWAFSVGGSYRINPHVALTLTLTEVLYLERDTRGVAGNESLQSPSRQPANAGVYRQNIVLAAPSLLLSY